MEYIILAEVSEFGWPHAFAIVGGAWAFVFYIKILVDM